MKRKVVHKVFFIWDYEQEEAWLNQMSAEGWQLVDVGFCRYVFTKGAPGEYQYRLEALENHAKMAQSQEYIDFVEETGAELVGSYLFWVYFRRKTEAGPFESFSDVESKLRHLKRFSRIPIIFIPILTLNIISMHCKSCSMAISWQAYCSWSLCSCFT